MIKITCDNCGKEIEKNKWNIDNYKHHFCSNKCRDEFAKPREKLLCKQCGKELFYYPSNPRKFCSMECYLEYNKEHNNSKINTICEWCGKEFIIRTDFIKDNNGRFCSRKCFKSFRNKETHVNIICEICGKEFSCSKKNMRRFCSKECSYIGRSGENNYGWKGGKSNNPYPQEWNETLRDSIRCRDSYICQECGIHEDENNRKLDVHHIDYNKDNLNPDNLISLCRECHMKTNHNRDYWIEYFNNR